MIRLELARQERAGGDANGALSTVTWVWRIRRYDNDLVYRLARSVACYIWETTSCIAAIYVSEV
jgi:hypothetical protein